MSGIQHFLTEYLLNSVWQVPLMFAVAWLLGRALQRLGPEAEHRVWVGALLAQGILPACSAPGFATGLATALRHLFAGEGAAHGAVAVTLGGARPLGAPGTAALLLRLGLPLYVAFTAFVTLRFLWQCMQLDRARREAELLTLDPADELFLRRCATSFHIARVHLASAASVHTPLTFGLRRPLLMLPPAFAAEASTPQLHAALSHELAHVARHDAAKQMLYRVLSLPIAYHPALWLTFARLTETRERVCDHMAAKLLGDARQYARTLVELASLLTRSRPALAHAIGLFDANQFERRVLMLNRRSLPLARSLRVALVTGGAIAGIAACTSAVALHLNVIAGAASNAQMKVAPNVMAGQIVSKVQPKYPEDAKKAKIQGSVVLAAIIDKDGTVQNLRVVSGPAELQASSIEAVRQWIYRPYLLNGEPTEVETTITVTYSFGG